MKMPTTNEKAKKEPKAPGSIQLEDENLDLGFGDAGTQCMTFLAKKMRNLEKRKKKMEINKEKVLNGATLGKEAQLSLEQYDMVTQDLQFAGELHKQFVSINQKNEECVKKMAKKEIQRIEEILKLQYTLDQMGGDGVRQDFITGKHGAVVLTQDNLDQLDALYQAISPTREKKEKDMTYAKKLFTAAGHLVNFVNGEESQVVGTTYKELKDLIYRINKCGYFERAPPAAPQEKPRDQEPVAVVEKPKEKEVEVVADAAVSEPEPAAPIIAPPTPEETFPPSDSAQAPPVEETQKQQQPLNTLEQDAFFAPSSSPFQSSGVVSDNTSSFSSHAQPRVNGSSSNSHRGPEHSSKSSLTDIQSFTHNRPFQFIQTSYVMPDTNSPTVVDPAVIAAQPAGAHGLQFISPLYDTPGIVTTSSVAVPQQQLLQTQPQQQQQAPTPPAQPHPPHKSNIVSAGGSSSLMSSQHQPQAPQAVPPQVVPPGAGVKVGLGMPVDLSQTPVDLSQAAVKQQQQQQQSVSTAPDYSVSVQSSYQQADSLFSSQSVVVGHDNNIQSVASLASHADSRTSSLRDDAISSISYDLPPSIPMPPSQSQDQSQMEPQEKKSPMNANAPVFQSMYSQGHKPVSMGSPSVTVGGSDIQVPSGQADFGNSFIGGPSGDYMAGSDFQSSYQGSNGFANSNYGRGPGGNRGGYRGSRGGGGAGGPNSNAMNSRNGGSPLQNGFGPRGSPTSSSNSRGGRGGAAGGGFQNFSGGPNTGYRSDSFATAGYGSGSFANTYQKRSGSGGMNNMGGPGNSGYPQRPNPMGGNMNRGGGMRGGGMPRGMPRGGGGAPRGFSRQQ